MNIKVTYHDGRTMEFHTNEMTPVDVYQMIDKNLNIINLNGRTVNDALVVVAK